MNPSINSSLTTCIFHLLILCELSSAFALSRSDAWPLQNERSNFDDKTHYVYKRASWTPQGRFGKRTAYNNDDISEAFVGDSSILGSGPVSSQIDDNNEGSSIFDAPYGLDKEQAPERLSGLSQKTNRDFARLEAVTKSLLRRVRNFRNLVGTETNTPSLANWVPGPGKLNILLIALAIACFF